MARLLPLVRQVRGLAARWLWARFRRSRWRSRIVLTFWLH